MILSIPATSMNFFGGRKILATWGYSPAQKVAATNRDRMAFRLGWCASVVVDDAIVAVVDDDDVNDVNDVEDNFVVDDGFELVLMFNPSCIELNKPRSIRWPRRSTWVV